MEYISQKYNKCVSVWVLEKDIAIKARNSDALWRVHDFISLSNSVIWYVWKWSFESVSSAVRCCHNAPRIGFSLPLFVFPEAVGSLWWVEIMIICNCNLPRHVSFKNDGHCSMQSITKFVLILTSFNLIDHHVTFYHILSYPIITYHVNPNDDSCSLNRYNLIFYSPTGLQCRWPPRKSYLVKKSPEGISATRSKCA